jgi:hypothetical protein
MVALLTWERWHPEPDGEDIAEALRGEVRDALWLVARQWQLGEFRAEDAGTAAAAHVLSRSSPLHRFGAPGGPPRAIPGDAPLNAAVERMAAAFDLTLRVETGREWRRLLLRAGKTSAWEVFRGNRLVHFRVREPEYAPEDPELPYLVDEPYVQMLAAVSGGRMVDGGRLFELLGQRVASAFLAAADPAVDALGNQWRTWVGERLGLPAHPQRACWDAGRLTYRFDSVAAHVDGTGESLKTTEHHGQAMDWFSFEQAPGDAALTGDLDPGAIVEHRHTFIPSPVSFPGMPRARWWEMEDDAVDLASLKAAKTDTGALLLAEFSLLFSNDWLSVPLPVPVGGLVKVRALKVTDVFGVQSSIQSAYGEGGAGLWELFQTNASGTPADHLCLPPVHGRWLQGAPVEEVRLVRDEMANMVWAIEQTVPDGMGNGTDGQGAALRVEARLRELAGVPTTPLPALQDSGARLRYVIATAVQPHWIPFIPIRPDAAKPDMVLRRAAMPRLIEGQTPTRIRPRTGILRAPATNGNRYDLREEDVPVHGLSVRAMWRRARWFDGQTVTWFAYEKALGTEPASSALQFDQVVPEEK